MKKIMFKTIASLLIFLFVGISCENTNEILVKERGVGVAASISNIEPAFYTTDFDNTFIKFDVDLPEGADVDAAELQASFNGKTVTIQSISSFPATIELPARDVMNKLGLTDDDVDVVNNNEFIFYVLTTSGGISTRSKSGSVKILVTCEFDPEMAVGSYHVVSSDWEVEGDVFFTADPNNPYKVFVSGIFEMEGGDPNEYTLELNISPTSFEVTGPRSQLGPQAPWGAYTNYYYTPTRGIYRSCTGTFEMQFQITVDQGSFGTYNFVFTKNNPV